MFMMVGCQNFQHSFDTLLEKHKGQEPYKFKNASRNSMPDPRTNVKQKTTCPNKRTSTPLKLPNNTYKTSRTLEP